MKLPVTKLFFLLSLAALLLAACNSGTTNSTTGQTTPTGAETQQIAKEAYIYGFPLVANYQTLYKQAVDTNDRDYRAPFNHLTRSTGVATPEDKFVVTPNSDTPYSFLWLDLRAEPVVVTMPKIDKGRYYTAQLIDLYTFNFAYLGSRTYGNDGGNYLVAGPGWHGDKPKGVNNVIHCETEFAYVLFRTQLYNLADLANVKKIEGYTAQPLSKFLGTPAPARSSRRLDETRGRHDHDSSSVPLRQFPPAVLSRRSVGESDVGSFREDSCWRGRQIRFLEILAGGSESDSGRHC
jgi:hypothetical protein